MSLEFDINTEHPVIHLMDEQEGVVNKGGTMRLGGYPCNILGDGVTSKAYGKSSIVERHRHRFEFNNTYKEKLSEVGLVAAGLSPDGRLVEIVEYLDHPFMAGTQFHPEFLSRPTAPHPLFKEFVGAASVWNLIKRNAVVMNGNLGGE